MRDQLVDIVSHTHKLGIFNDVKVIGTDTSTRLETEAEDKSVIMRAEFINPSAEFMGTFGMPGIAQLSTLLNLDEYRDDAKITVTTKEQNGETICSGIHFENKSGNFENDYRFMTSALVNEKLKELEFNEPPYEVVLEPSLLSIQRLRQQSLANANELLFTATVNGTDLIFNFGDHSTNSGKFIFAEDQNDGLDKRWAYPVAQVMGILALAGNLEMKFSNAGALVITCNSGLIKYTYILPAQAK
jgi:hypothetical protein